MTPDVDLMLATLERALSASIVPDATTASAKEEAALALLFSRWVRQVLDPLAAVERTSHRDCHAALADVAGRLETAGLAAATDARATENATIDPDAAPGALRASIRRLKDALGRALRDARASGDGALADEIRLRLFDLGVAEIERERAFGRPTGVDPEWKSLPSLDDLARRESEERKESS